MRYAATVGMALLLVLGSGQPWGRGASALEKDGLAEQAQTWLYPKANLVSSAEAAGRVFQAVLTTTDDLDVVLTHYDQKCGTALAGNGTPGGAHESRTEFADGKVKSTLSTNDSTGPVVNRKNGAPRGVTLRQVTRDEPGFFVTVLVTRTKDDTATHLLITFLKK